MLSYRVDLHISSNVLWEYFSWFFSFELVINQTCVQMVSCYLQRTQMCLDYGLTTKKR